jgi:hypothetical protein
MRTYRFEGLLINLEELHIHYRFLRPNLVNQLKIVPDVSIKVKLCSIPLVASHVCILVCVPDLLILAFHVNEHCLDFGHNVGDAFDDVRYLQSSLACMCCFQCLLANSRHFEALRNCVYYWVL